MQNYQDELTEASKIIQKKIAETEKKIGDTTLQAQNEFSKTFEEMSRAVMSRATAEIEFGVRLTQRLSEAHSLPDVVSAYQEWLGQEMSARSEDERQFKCALAARLLDHSAQHTGDFLAGIRIVGHDLKEFIGSARAGASRRDIKGR